MYSASLVSRYETKSAITAFRPADAAAGQMKANQLHVFRCDPIEQHPSGFGSQARILIGPAWPIGFARVGWRFPFDQALGWSLHEDFKSRGVFSFLSIAGAIGAAVLWRGAHGAEA